MILQFSIPGEPNGQGRPRFTTFGGHVKAYDPAKSRNYKAFVKLLAMEAAKEAGWQCSDKPICVSISCQQSIPKSATKKFRERALNLQEMPTKKPDVDNIYKGIADAMTGIVYKDDKQIISSEVFKTYAETPNVIVRVWEWQLEGKI